jgi:hypothetical protein
MKKPLKVRRLTLSRETLIHLDRLDGAQLDKVAGGSYPLQCTLSSCVHPCPCPP